MGTDADHPSVAITKLHTDIREHDIILVYSDGISDNLSTEAFTKYIQNLIDPNTLRLTSFSQAAIYQARTAYVLSKQ